MGTTSSAIFTGSSAYSTDFQNVINRAVAIASLPITQLTSDKTALTSQSTELQKLDSKFAAVQTALQKVSQALDGSTFDAVSSDDSVAAASVSTGATEGNYSIEVDDVGAYPTSLSIANWTAASGSARTFQLCVGSNQYSFTPADNGASSVAQAINAQFGDQVRATVVNVGSASTPDYRISLQGAKLADTPLDIVYAGQGLQSAQTRGRPAQYIVNGSGVTVTSNTRNVSLSTGVNVTLVSSGATPVDITVTRSTSALSDALSTFAAAYNDAADEIDSQRGQSGGPLQGQSVINQLSQSLSGMSTYASPVTGFGGLVDLGLTLGSDGKLTFNSFALIAADLVNPNGITSFLGTVSGGGFLKTATDLMKGLEDPVTGLIKTSEAALSSQITALDSTIADKQSKVDDLQLRLQNQMAAADALISAMEQKYSYISSMFEAMNTADKQYA